MRVRKGLAAILIAATCCASNLAQAADHLTPCKDTLSDYYTRVETLMSQAAPGEALWKVTVFPTRRQAEWSVRATRLDDGYALTVVRFDRSLWDASWSASPDNHFHRDTSTAKAEPHAITRKISPRLFAELEAQIRQAVETARPNENTLDDIVVDSPEFRFETPGPRCAHTFSFDEGTRVDKLVGIVLQLCNLPAESKLLRMLKDLER